MPRPTQGSTPALRLRGCHPLWRAFPDASASLIWTTGLLRFRSPLLPESRLMSFPPGTEMFQFPGFASRPYVFRPGYPLRGGLPHSDMRGSTLARNSPRLIAACHVLHRLLAPRHPPDALLTHPESVPPPPPARPSLLARPRSVTPTPTPARAIPHAHTSHTDTHFSNDRQPPHPGQQPRHANRDPPSQILTPSPCKEHDSRPPNTARSSRAW